MNSTNRYLLISKSFKKRTIQNSPEFCHFQVNIHIFVTKMMKRIRNVKTDIYTNKELCYKVGEEIVRFGLRKTNR